MIGWILVAAAFAVAAVVGVLALRRPILFRMAARNAMRRPKQTATVIAGLMIGTAIISAALVAGQSATSAIRGAVYDALEDVDETARLEGFHFFPEEVLDDLVADPAVSEQLDGWAANAIWSMAADSPRTDLFEPDVSVVGYDFERERDFGVFGLRGGGTDPGRLAAGEIAINAELADALEVDVGDQLYVAYTLPVDPLLPTFELFAGTLGPGLSLPLPAPVPADAVAPSTVHTFQAPAGSTHMTFVLQCGEDGQGCPDATTLRLEATGPDGTRAAVAHEPVPDRCTGASCPPTPNPLWLNVTGDVGGTWSLRVTGQISAQTGYGLVAVAFEPVYDLGELQERAQTLEDGLPEGFDVDDFGARAEATFTVALVSDRDRGVMFDMGPTAFLPLDAMQEMLHRPSQVNYLKFSNHGDVRTGIAGTEAAEMALKARLQQVQAARSEEAVQHLEIKTLKRDFIQVADDAGQLMTSLMIFAGSLSIITGLLLIVNIFTMLAEERRSELGMARAVGLSRRDLIRLFLFEGSLYALVAAFIGALLGLLLALGMITGLNWFVANSSGDFPPIPFAPGPSAVPIAFATGALLTFVTIYFASRRASRLNIVRAIRQIDEPETSGRPWMVAVGAPLATAGLLVTVVGWLLNQFSMQVFGPLGVAVGLMVALRPFMRRKPLDMALAAALGLYYALIIFLIQEFEHIEEANVVGPIRGVIMTLCIVVVATYWAGGPRALGKALSKVRRLRAIATPAMAYPQHKRFRTGMTLAMFSIVILSIGFFSIFGGLFDVDPARQTGGFDVEATTTLRVADLAEYDRGLLDEDAIVSSHAIVDYLSFLPDFITVEGERTGHFGPPQHHVFGIRPDFIDDQEFRLLWTLDDMTDEEAYNRLFSDPDAIIVGYTYSTNERGQDLSHEVGERLTIHAGDCRDPVAPDAGDVRVDCPSFTIIGIQEQYHHNAVWLPAERVNQMLPQHRDLHLFDLAPGTDAVAFAKDLERNYRDVGMDAEASIEEVKKEQATFRQLLGAMKVFLGLGLIVGVLSLGIITSRSVLERRQEIGVLRALGYTGNMIRRIFFIEVTLIILMGAIIGIISSIIVTFGLWYAVIRELQYPYTIPWGEIGLLLLISYAVALLATAAPILRAAKVPPAEALRYIE